jgi:AraC-like DNA-binding protein
LHQSFLPSSGQARAHVWKFSHQFGGRRPRHFHAEPELNLLLAGSARFGVGDTIVEASAGDLLGFPPGQDHVLLESSPDLYLFAIGIEPRWSAEVLGEQRDSVCIPLHARLSTGDFQALVARAAQIVDRDDIDQYGAELWEHASWIQQKHRAESNGGIHALTRRTLGLLSAAPHLDRDLLAHKLRASSSAISRYFHRDVGMTLVQYRTRLRLLDFIRAVDRGGDLKAAAVAAGFGSYSQCHRSFQAELGCAPREFFSELRQRMQRAYQADAASAELSSMVPS